MATRVTDAPKRKPRAEVITVPNPASYPVFPDWFKPVAEPYTVEFKIELTKPYLFNRWDVELVEPSDTQATRRVKKGAPPEALVTLNEAGELCFPAAQLLMSTIQAGKNYRNPRSTKGTLGTVLREGLMTPVGCDLVSWGVDSWDFIDVRRAHHAQSWVPKRRPALESGHRATSRFEVTLPEYIEPAILNKVLQDAGRLYGIGDGRTAPLFMGRFMVHSFDVIED